MNNFSLLAFIQRKCQQPVPRSKLKYQFTNFDSPTLFNSVIFTFVAREGVIIDHDVIVIFPLGRFY